MILAPVKTAVDVLAKGNDASLADLEKELAEVLLAAEALHKKLHC